MSTTLAELVDDVRKGLGLTPQEARLMVLRLVPTVELAAISADVSEGGGSNWCIGRAFQVGVAGQFAHSQLFNPAASGTVLLVHQVLGTTDATATCGIARFDTALTTLGVGKDWADFRRSGSPVAEVRSEANVAQLGDQIYTTRIKSDDFFQVTFPAPVILPAGTGLLVRHGIFAADLHGSFFWREERA